MAALAPPGYAYEWEALLARGRIGSNQLRAALSARIKCLILFS